MTDCNHVDLKLLEGPIHPDGKDYYCPKCGAQFRAEPFTIGVSYGTPAAHPDYSKPLEAESLEGGRPDVSTLNEVNYDHGTEACRAETVARGDEDERSKLL